MDSLPSDKILKYNDDTLEPVRRTFGLDKPGEMKNAVDILEEWVKQQDHFTMKQFDRRYLETTIIVSKGSIERAKLRLDRGCTLKTMMPHIYGIHDIRPFFEQDLKDVKQAVMPKMTKNHERVVILYNYGKTFEPTVLDSYVRTLPTDGCGFRMKALYILTTSKMIEVVVTIAKQILSKKMGERIYVLKDRESLHNFIDKDVLPKEYGGNEKSLGELHDEWINVLYSEDHIKYFNIMSSAKTDVMLRQRKDKFNADYMDMPGTFRTLNLD